MTDFLKTVYVYAAAQNRQTRKRCIITTTQLVMTPKEKQPHLRILPSIDDSALPRPEIRSFDQQYRSAEVSCTPTTTLQATQQCGVTPTVHFADAAHNSTELSSIPYRNTRGQFLCVSVFLSLCTWNLTLRPYRRRVCEASLDLL